MKQNVFLLFALPLFALACNNQVKDSVETADSINKASTDTSNMPITRQTITTDEETSKFLVNAANGGMAEVQLGQMAKDKAMSDRVKNFGSMMVSDHSTVNDQVKNFAEMRNVTLPMAVGDDKQKTMDDLYKKGGADFDKAFMKTMVKEHEDAIDLFEKYSKGAKDAEIKTFADNTLPKLRAHLDSAKAIQRMIK